MKHFKIVGPESTREFDIEDDEMLSWNLKVLKISDYGKIKNPKTYQIQNEEIHPTETS